MFELFSDTYRMENPRQIYINKQLYVLLNLFNFHVQEAAVILNVYREVLFIEVSLKVLYEGN